jgi:hypothetical protein
MGNAHELPGRGGSIIQDLSNALGGPNNIQLEQLDKIAKQNDPTILNTGFEEMKKRLTGLPVSNPS